MYELTIHSMDSVQPQTEKIFMDTFSEMILDFAVSPKSAQEISYECNISISTVYRRIHSLVKLGLIIPSGHISDGVRVYTYQRNMRFKYGKYNPRVKIILQVISENPGICFTELQESTGYPNGTLSHNITNLIKDSKLIVQRTNRRTWYFSANTDPSEINIIIHLRKETTKRILVFLLANEKASFTNIRNEIKKSPSTVSLTLTHLIDYGLVRRIPGIKPKYELINKEMTYNVLKRISPSTLDKIKDRFVDTFSYL